MLWAKKHYDCCCKELAKRLKKARLVEGATQLDIAITMGLTLSDIQRIEAGKRDVGAIELHRLAQIYKKPLVYFDTTGFDRQMKFIKRNSGVQGYELPIRYRMVEVRSLVGPKDKRGFYNYLRKKNKLSSLTKDYIGFQSSKTPKAPKSDI